MSEPIRVLHFADVHIGMENFGRTDPTSGLSSRVVDFLRRLDEMVAYARQHGVDLTIFAGDAFKTRTPSPTFQREFAWRMRDLAELAPLVMLVGNHDLAPNILKASSIEIYDTLAVPNIWVAQEYETRRITTHRGDVIVGTAPYPIRARLMKHVENGVQTIREVDAQMENSLASVLGEMAAEADHLAGTEIVPRILTGHFTVRGAVLGSERQVMLGRDIQISLPLLADPRWDYVALGHIHKHQNLTYASEDAPPVVYCGSIERIDFGEESDTKGFCWVDLARNQAQWQFIPVAVRPMLTLRIDCRKEPNPTRKVIELIRKHQLHESIVRMFIQLTPETDGALNDLAIRDALRQAGVFHIATIKRDVERADRARLAANPEGMTHEQLLEQYLISREYERDHRAHLMDAAREIMNEED